MAKRAVQDLDIDSTTANAGTPFDVALEETAPIATGKARMGSGTARRSTSVTIASPGENKSSTARPATGEPEGLEVLQLMAKGQALSSAVMVVEGVLHKMEEQARTLAVSSS